MGALFMKIVTVNTDGIWHWNQCFFCHHLPIDADYNSSIIRVDDCNHQASHKSHPEELPT
jgi:hypothetical protein